MSLFSRLLGKAPAEKPPMATRPSETGAMSETVATEPIRSSLSQDEILAIALGSRGGHEQRAAQKQLADLLDAQSISAEQLPTSANREALLAVFALTKDVANFNRVADSVDDAALWVRLATTGSSTRLRQLSAQRVAGEEHLRAVLKAAKESDKSVFRIARTKLDEIHAAAKQLDAARAHKMSLAETIERHSYRPFDGAFVATLEHLVAEWQSLPIDVPDETRSRVDTAIERARESITNHIRAAGAQAAREAAIANAQPVRETTIIELQKVLAAICGAAEFDAAGATSVRERLNTLRERWNDTLQFKPANAAERADFDRLVNACEKLAAGCATQGSIIQQTAALSEQSNDSAVTRLQALLAHAEALPEQERPESVRIAAEATRTWRESRDAAKAAVADSERQLSQLIRRAQQALSSGQSRQALGIRRSIDAKLKHATSPPKHVLERLQQLDSKLQELQDWKSFAVAPKRSELIEQMQALIGSDEDPPKLAEKIKDLQEEWKSLARGSTDSEDDWTKFHEAAQAAYVPCREYFEAQSQLRERNLERRKALVAKLEQYDQSTDWEHVDWKHVANAIRAAKQEWRDSGPTDRAPTKALEKRFDALLAAVQQRLDAEYASNLEQKQSLVKQAQRLATITDLAQASNEVKRLQSAWKSVGLTSHAEGQKLWEEFKQLCDAVFDKRREQHNSRLGELKQQESSAIALCQEAEGLAARSGPELYAGAARMRELRDAFADVGELPRESAQQIQRRFKRATEHFDQAVVRERAREVGAAWDNLFTAANRVRLHQLESEPSAEAVREEIAAIQHWPKGGLQAIERKLAQGATSEVNANEAALRELVIRAEIASGQSTPERDQGQRRAMQLQALVNGTGRTTATMREQLEKLAFEWVSIGPVTNAIYEELFARFQRAWNASRH